MQGTQSKRPVVLEPGTSAAGSATVSSKQSTAEGGTKASAGFAAENIAADAPCAKTEQLKVPVDTQVRANGTA